MTILFYGAGGSAAGVTNGGFGVNFHAPIPAPHLFDDPFSPSHLDGRRIDPVTRDYTINPSTGSIYGMTAAQQLVELAFTTVLGSSAVSGLGNDILSIQKITDSFANDVTQKIRTALSDLVNRNVITLISVTVDRVRTNGGYFVTRWIDNSTSQEQIKVI